MPQRHRIDWDAARAAYVTLDRRARTYARISRDFGVSTVTVRKHAHADNWEAEAERADKEAAEKALSMARRTRSQRVARTLNFIDDAIDVAASRLEAGKLDMKAADVPPLVKLAELLEGEATDRVQVGEVRALIIQVTVAAGRWVTSELPPEERRVGFMGELGEITAGLGEVVEG